MAKKKTQNIVITDKELTPSIIGKIDTKEKSPWLLIFIFIIFIAVAIFLPDINNYIEAYLKGNNQEVTITPENSVNKEKEETTNEDEVTYYDYSTELVIADELFTMSNIVTAENKIYFDLKNNKENVLDLDNYKYFLEIYNSDTTLLQRIKISFGEIEAGATKSYSYGLEEGVANNLAKLLIISKTEADYPDVTLKQNDTGFETMVCKTGYEEITYTFGNNQLSSINRVVNYPFTNDSQYTLDLQAYQAEAAVNNNYDGVSATLITSTTGFVYTTLIDLQTADINLLNNKNYYSYRTLAKTVKFETESNGFICE